MITHYLITLRKHIPSFAFFFLKRKQNNNELSLDDSIFQDILGMSLQSFILIAGKKDVSLCVFISINLETCSSSLLNLLASYTTTVSHSAMMSCYLPSRRSHGWSSQPAAWNQLRSKRTLLYWRVLQLKCGFWTCIGVILHWCTHG